MLKDNFIYRWLDDYFSRDERAKIKNLKKVIEKQRYALRNAEETIIYDTELIKDLSEKLKFLNGVFLTEDEAKKPAWLSDGYVYQPVVRAIYIKTKSISATENVKLDPTDIYAISPALVKLVEEQKWEDLPLDEKLDAIWGWVIRNIDYKSDVGDEWRYPTTTYYLRKGDCEDSTILFVTLCRIAKVPSDRIFNAVGYFGTVCHSFPVAKNSKGWHVYETTLNDKPPQPVKFGPPYKATYGFANWKFKGVGNPD